MSIFLTKDNHFLHGYSQQQPFALRENEKQIWSYQYGAVKRPVRSFQKECLQSALEIKSLTQKPIYVAYSGGIDSEVVMESFRLSGIPVIAAVMRFSEGLNQHDIEWAEKYCFQHKIPIQYFDYSPVEFYKSQWFFDIALKTSCYYPMLIFQMQLAEDIHHQGGFPVLGSAECYLEKQANDSWVMYEREIYSSLYRFQVFKNLAGVMGFFQWSPELIYSYLMDKTLQDLVHNKIPQARSTADIKFDIYSRYFALIKREKYYGWEKIKDLEYQTHLQLKKIIPHPLQEIKTEISDVFKCLNPNGFDFL
jgi:hypothetical protein